MSQNIPKAIRLKISLLAGLKCEYCFMPEYLSQYNFHIDHIISQKHGGLTKLMNLAYCCPHCNFNKGSDIATLDKVNPEKLIRFYSPRKDIWNEHFEFFEGQILGISPIGEATESILKFNEINRLILRKQLIDLEIYPLKQT